MNKTALAKKIRKLTAKPAPDDFIFDLLLAYGLPKSSVTLLKKGGRNMLAAGGGVTMKRKLFFLPLRPEDDPLTVRNEVLEGLTEDQRFVVLTDYVRFYAYDTKFDEALDCDLVDLADHYDFFFPWAGIEKTRHYDENPADVKAAGRMAKLFDVIRKDNPDDSPEFVHDLNVFFSRLLFCFFAEDTGIFPGDNLFTNGVDSQTQLDAHDLKEYLGAFFAVLDRPTEQRTGVRAHFLQFPYVNGGLFRDPIQIPVFSARSRRAIIDAGLLDWADINPDIFGSMIQAVVDTEKRGGLGMHYTSVPNIMKVIEPLFLNDLRETFTGARDGRYEKSDLKSLRERIGKLKIFDPACGSGNFLIIAYKELRKLEMEIIQRQAELGAAAGAGGSLFERGAGAASGITLNQFYGIEIDDFAHEIAILALWLAEHQMNADFERVFGRSKPTLPLADAGHIVHANACRVDWEEVCPKVEGDETYILGNPPYLGGKMQSKDQKSDMKFVFGKETKYKLLDYVSCWIILSKRYLTASSKAAFVTTSSICEGSQVNQLWPKVLDESFGFLFAYTAFNWSNKAKGKAGVTCVIVGLGFLRDSDKMIFYDNKTTKVNCINQYLVEGIPVFVDPQRTSISGLPKIVTGNNPYEGGNLLMSGKEKKEALAQHPAISPFLRKVVGSYEMINDVERWGLWISEEKLGIAKKIPFINRRINATKEWRMKGGDVARSLAKYPYRFRFTNVPKEFQIVVPMTSSGRRDYFPISIYDSSYVVLASAQTILDPDLYVYSIINSWLHGKWVKILGGKMREDYRYNTTLCYNTFPFPPITPTQEATLTTTALGILAAREQHPGRTLAELYDPDKMPDNLREAHRANDLAVEACYRAEPFTSDEERLAYLFKLYEEMIAAEAEKDTLFSSAATSGGAAQKKAKKTRKKKK